VKAQDFYRVDVETKRRGRSSYVHSGKPKRRGTVKGKGGGVGTREGNGTVVTGESYNAGIGRCASKFFQELRKGERGWKGLKTVLGDAGEKILLWGDVDQEGKSGRGS